MNWHGDYLRGWPYGDCKIEKTGDLDHPPFK